MKLSKIAAMIAMVSAMAATDFGGSHKTVECSKKRNKAKKSRERMQKESRRRNRR